MKKLNYTRIIVLVLSIALLLGSVMAITTAAAEDASTGEFGSISLAYADRVAIIVAVDATEEEIKNGTVVVKYNLCGSEANAEYFNTDANGTWVITEGIAAYNLAEVVTFSSYVDGVQVEADRTYSVAQFLYTMLYTENSISAEKKDLYESLLNYGAAAQTALKGAAEEELVTNSSIVYTSASDIKINNNGGKVAFAPAGDVTVTPVYTGAIPIGAELVGWNVVNNGNDESVELTFTASGKVEVVSPVFNMIDPTPYTLVNGGFENGLEGWTLVGNIGNVSGDKSYWTNENEGKGYEFGKDGEYMFSAYAPGAYESAVGTLTSSSFTVGGSGFVTFKLGAMKDGNYVYVDVVDASSHEILARYYNGLWADTTGGIKSGCTLVPYKADLREFMGKNVYFRISDNAYENYGLFFVDSFVTYNVTEPQGFNDATPVGYDVSGTVYDVFNGGFELGALQGWHDVGGPGKVTNANAFWDGREYGKDGDYLYSGVEDLGGEFLETKTGTLTSSVFEIGGAGYITYMLGGGNDICYVQVIDSTTGELLARYRQQALDGGVLKSYVADLTAYIGRSVRIQLVDNATSDWGCVSFDNVVTYHTEKPEGIEATDVKYQIVNGSFESGIGGWTMDLTEKGTFATLGWVLNKEDDHAKSDWYTSNTATADGNKLFTFAVGGDNCENTKGTMSSESFILKNNTFVSFKFGAAGTRDVYIELCKADGTVIETFYNEVENKVNTLMYSYYYQYTGEETECFFRIVDNSTGNYGCFVVDGFNVNLEGAPEGYIPAVEME